MTDKHAVDAWNPLLFYYCFIIIIIIIKKHFYICITQVTVKLKYTYKYGTPIFIVPKNIKHKMFTPVKYGSYSGTVGAVSVHM